MKNKGFSLIEVIVAVAILAAISAPILRSFTTAAVTNSKAQSIQDATSLAEDVMEKVKSTQIEDLYKEATGAKTGKIGENTIDPSKTTFSFKDPSATSFVSDPPYQIVYEDISATLSKKYDATVTISTDEYKTEADIENGQLEILDASDANVFKAPSIKELDSSKHLILSWEINGYDESAVDRLVDENAIEMTERSTICGAAASNGHKKIRIELKPVVEGGHDYIKIDCFVSYEITGYPNAVEFLTYTGTLPEPEPDASGVVKEGPNVYLFYSTTRGAGGTECFRYEDIEINDTTSGYVHNIYVIMQNNMHNFVDNSGSPVIDVDIVVKHNNSPVISGTSAITKNIVPLGSSGAKLYTNAAKAEHEDKYMYLAQEQIYERRNMFDQDPKDRIYYVTVVVSAKDGTVLNTLTSTMETGPEADK